MDGGAADRGPLQFHRLEDRHRIDQAGPAGAPFHLFQYGLPQFIRPFESDGMPGEFRRPPQGLPVRDVIIGQDQPVRGDVVVFYLLLEQFDGIRDAFLCHQIMFHHLEALLLQETELLRHQTARAASFPRFGAHQSKRIEPHIPPGRNLVVQLSHGAAAEVPGILVLRVHVLYPGIYLLKVRVADNRLAP